MKMEKLCYTVPEYNPLTSEHYYHVYELLEDVGRRLDIFLVIEKSTGRPEVKGVKNIYTMKLARFPVNLLERLSMFCYIRWKGYRKFYIHYSYSSAIIASIVTRVFGGQTLYWHCGLKKDFMNRWAMNWSAIKAKLFEDYAFLLSIRLAKFLVTGSETMRHYYATNFGLQPGKIKVMPNWVSLGRFDAGKYDREGIRQEFQLDTGTKVVLFVHWLSPRKGPQYLAPIARGVVRDIRDVVFLIVGDGPYRGRLKQEITENGLDESMRLVGSVPNQEIPKYYAVADLLIMPSEEEGFPRVLIEAMAMGVPFVAADVGSVREIATEKQKLYVVPKGDVVSFADKVVTLLKDDELRDELKKKGLVRVGDFSKDKVANTFTSDIV